MLNLKAYAKVNLVLEVLGRRADGYHEIASVMQTVGLYDNLAIEAADELEFSCTVPELLTVDNLVLKAARALGEYSRVKPGARMALEKNIPRDAGLGGGSSDAAAALKGLNRLWELGLSSGKLAEIGAGIGSDVPFFIYGGTCLARGRGETVTPLPDIVSTWFVLLKPGVTVPAHKTAALYSLLQTRHFSAGGLADAAVERLKAGRTGAGPFYNTFDNVAVEAYKGLESYWEAMEKAGAAGIHLAGSGPFLFCAFGSRREALVVQGELSRLKLDSILAPGVGRDETGY